MVGAVGSGKTTGLLSQEVARSYLSQYDREYSEGWGGGGANKTPRQGGEGAKPDGTTRTGSILTKRWHARWALTEGSIWTDRDGGGRSYGFSFRMGELQAHSRKVSSSVWLNQTALVKQGAKCGKVDQGHSAGSSQTKLGSCPYSDLKILQSECSAEKESQFPLT